MGMRVAVGGAVFARVGEMIDGALARLDVVAEDGEGPVRVGDGAMAIAAEICWAITQPTIFSRAEEEGEGIRKR